MDSPFYSATDSQPSLNLLVIHSSHPPKALNHRPHWRPENELMNMPKRSRNAKSQVSHPRPRKKFNVTILPLEFLPVPLVGHLPDGSSI